MGSYNINTKRYIFVTPEQKKYLAKLFDVSPKYVYMCLAYRENAGKAPKIRKAAIERGGVPMVHTPEMECIHFEAPHVMMQHFPNGASLAVNFENGTITITDRKGNDIEIKECKGIQIISELQAKAAAL